MLIYFQKQHELNDTYESHRKINARLFSRLAVEGKSSVAWQRLISTRSSKYKQGERGCSTSYRSTFVDNNASLVTNTTSLIHCVSTLALTGIQTRECWCHHTS